jgi:hypothetical protein
MIKKNMDIIHYFTDILIEKLIILTACKYYTWISKSDNSAGSNNSVSIVGIRFGFV